MLLLAFFAGIFKTLGTTGGIIALIFIAICLVLGVVVNRD